MSRLISLLVTFFAIGFSLAADNVATLKVWHCDGSVSSYTLSESSRISFSQAEMCYSDGDWSVRIPLSDIKTWTYDPSSSGIGDMMDNTARIHISQTSESIIISGIRRQDKVNVFASDGRAIYETAEAENPLVIGTSSWVSGVYITSHPQLSGK